MSSNMSKEQYDELVRRVAIRQEQDPEFVTVTPGATWIGGDGPMPHLTVEEQEVLLWGKKPTIWERFRARKSGSPRFKKWWKK